MLVVVHYIFAIISILPSSPSREVATLYTKLSGDTTGITGATDSSTVGHAYTRLAIDPNTWTILSNDERTLERLQAACTNTPPPPPTEIDGHMTELDGDVTALE